MRATSERTTPRSSEARHLPVAGLRTGKIRATKGSAAQIRLKVGVTPADERMAVKALTEAAAKPKAKAANAPRKASKVAAQKR